jgi:hypothetical protein
MQLTGLPVRPVIVFSMESEAVFFFPRTRSVIVSPHIVQVFLNVDSRQIGATLTLKT